MSEYTLPEGSGYIYVGEYFHKFGKDIPTEKKIGKTDSLLNIPQIDDYSFSLDFHTPDIYLVDDVEKLLIDKHQSLFLDKLQSFKRKVQLFGFYFASLDIRQDSRAHDKVFTAMVEALIARTLLTTGTDTSIPKR